MNEGIAERYHDYVGCVLSRDAIIPDFFKGSPPIAARLPQTNHDGAEFKCDRCGHREVIGANVVGKLPIKIITACSIDRYRRRR